VEPYRNLLHTLFDSGSTISLIRKVVAESLGLQKINFRYRMEEEGSAQGGNATIVNSILYEVLSRG